MTHKTLPLPFADCVFKSISLQAMRDDKQFEVLYLYNTHSADLSNESLIELFEKYDLKRFFKEVKVFPYDENTTKTVSADVHAIGEFVRANYAPEDRYFMHKSDCLLSKNFLDDILHLEEDKLIYYSTPFINAKERVSNEDIFEYCTRDSWIKSDDITFFVEDMDSNAPTDFQTRPGCNVTDPQFKFTSCYGIRNGFSTHFVSVGLSDRIQLQNNLTWGGVEWHDLIPNFVGTNRCFLVHKYHDIVSENRATDREGPAPIWLKS